MQLYQPDHCLPATNILFDTQELYARVGSWLPDSKLSLDSIRYKPNTSCLVNYRVESSDKASSFIHIKAFSLKDWATRKQKIVSKNPDVLFDDELAFALFKFPSDAEIDGLEKFYAAPQEVLSRVLFRPFQDDSISNVETLAYKPNRRYTAKVDFASGQSAVLKLHDESTFSEVIKSATLLKKPSMVFAPDRIGRSNRYQALAYQWIDGTSISFDNKTIGQCQSLAEEIFEYLDRLHVSTKKQRKPIQTRQNSLTALGQYLGKIHPQLQSDSTRIAESILQLRPTADNSTIIHGDLHEQQLLRSKSGLIACDLDNCRVGDSTEDLANLVAHLQYRACLGVLPDDLVNSLDELSIRRHANRNDALRYRWNRTASLFQLASHPFRSGASAWTAQIKNILELSNKQLEDLKQQTSVAVTAANDSAPTAGISVRTSNCSAKIKSDPKFASLAQAFDMSTAEQRIKKDAPECASHFGEFKLGNVLGWRHKTGRRCMLQFELHTDSGPKFVLGKASAKRLDKRTRKTHKALYKLHEFDCNSKDGISVPKPMGCVADWNMWFQEKVVGESGCSLLANGQLKSVADRVANAIAKLHQSNFTTDRVHSIEDELSILNKRLSETIVKLPEQEDSISRIWRNCQLIGQAINEHPAVPIHRDFYQDQILFSENRTTLVDLDLVSMGHPALDVGNFLAHLTEHSLRNYGHANHWSEEEQQIQSRYLELNSDVSVHDIQAFKTLSLARHIAISASRPRRADSTPLIIEEVESQITDHMSCSA